MTNRLSLVQTAKPDARIATIENSAFGGAAISTPGPSLFRASRIQSGNYTCIASNRHGTYSASMSINVFCKYIFLIEIFNNLDTGFPSNMT